MEMIKYAIAFLLAYIAYNLLFNMVEHYLYNDPVLEELKFKLSAIDPKIKDMEIYEGNKSYTVNKKKIYICTKDENGNYYDKNMLTYVICHEYAHTLCTEIGHTELFNEIFQVILKKAEIAGVYNPNIPPIKNYCGHT